MYPSVPFILFHLTVTLPGCTDILLIEGILSVATTQTQYLKFFEWFFTDYFEPLLFHAYNQQTNQIFSLINNNKNNIFKNNQKHILKLKKKIFTQIETQQK